MSTATPDPASQPPAVYVRPDVPGESLGIAAFVIGWAFTALGVLVAVVFSIALAKAGATYPA